MSLFEKQVLEVAGEVKSLEKAPTREAEARFIERFAVGKVPSVQSVAERWISSDLSEAESNELQLFLFDHYDPEANADTEVRKDFESLKQITGEVKSIRKQSVLLVGERVHQAREILRKYGERCFSKWLLHTFNSRQTGYNALRYYELYSDLGEETLRLQMKAMPLKAAYTLASREGSIDAKKEILKGYNGEKQKETIALIQETLPLAPTDKRGGKEPGLAALDKMYKLSDAIQVRKQELGPEEKQKVATLIKELQELL